jgi:predicted DsbA family dithiol-disulfide isomerase
VRTDRLREEQGVRYQWTVFPLHPETPEQGIELSELFAGRDFDLAASQKRLEAVAAELGLPLESRSRSYNSRRAQELGKFAEQLGLMEPYLKSVYRAYFVEGRNIGLVDEIVEIGKRAGVPEDGARAVLLEGRCGEQVDRDWHRARLMGITGVPAFVANGKLLVGFRPYQDFLRLVAAG